MKALRLNLLLCAIMTTTLMKLKAVLSDTIIVNDANDQKMLISQQQQLQQLQQMHHGMSCYVCSTMDYENPADNLCRFMKPHLRSPSGLHNQPSLTHSSFHTASMMNYPTQTTTTTIPSSPTSNYNTILPSSPEALVSSAQHYPMSTYGDDSVVQLGPSSTPSSSIQSEPHHNHSNSINNWSYGNNDDTQIVNPSTNSTLNQQHEQSQQQNSLIDVHHNPYPQVQHRVPPSANYIRSRPCLEDENFCSIVSVVRIEFISDNLVSRFWAMERNCSKSCNTGCMLIGERVRLRVCSQCCRTPNCNIGSGTSTMFNLNLNQLIILLLSLILFRDRMGNGLNHFELEAPSG